MMDISVIKVIGLVPNAAAPGGMLQTDQLGQLAVDDAANWDVLVKYQRSGNPIGIVRDETTARVRLAWPAESDLVAGIGATSPNEIRVMVQLMKRPTMLYLDRSGARFDPLLRLFEQALRDQSTVAVGVFPGDDTIKDARVIP